MRVLALLLVDAMSLMAGLMLAYLIMNAGALRWIDEAGAPSLPFYRLVVLLLVPSWQVIFAIIGLYRDDLLGGSQEYGLVANGMTLGIIMVLFAGLVYPALIVGRAWLLLIWLLGMMSMILGRYLLRGVTQTMDLGGLTSSLHRKAVVVGAGEEGRAIAQQIGAMPEAGLEIVGFLDDQRPVDAVAAAGLRVLGSTTMLDALLAQGQVTDVILSGGALAHDRLLWLFERYGTRNDLTIRLSPGLYEFLTTGAHVTAVAGVPLVSLDRVRIGGLDAVLKMMLDYIVALAGLLLGAPLLLVIAMLVRFDSRGPIFHRRRVLGLGGREFDALKFRTMVVNADELLNRDEGLRQAFERNHKLSDDPRVTRLGHILRRLSLDELPQLFNVLRGEMSVVGPRMITPDEHRRYGKWGTNLLTVKPGITGLWQVSGRADLSYDERVRLDMLYIRNYSIWMDIRLLFQTIGAVLRGVGAY
jgi:exopolysaccharide biosynthesis polyprenyl glycosylphosphotransferase